MIDPHNVTKFDRNREELEEYLLFCIVVANKTAIIQAQKLEQFLSGRKNLTPFEYIKQMIKFDHLLGELMKVKMGQYSRICNSLKKVVQLDPETCTFGDLMTVPGIGAKTANYYLLHSRKGFSGAALDTHVLKHLNNNGILAPKSTPAYGAKYLQLEEAFINLWKKERPELTLAEYDLEIWKKYTRTKETII